MATIKYYPTTMVQTDLSTTGNLFLLDGEPYVGPYYLTYDGKAFTGPNPAAGLNQLLEPRSLATSPRTGRTSRRRDNVAATNIATAFTRLPELPTTVQLKQVVPYYPIVLESDYARGYFTRYFAKKVNLKGYITEISYETYATILSREDITLEDYEVEDMLWQLVGPLNDTRISQYQIKGGVYDTNKRVTEAKAKGFAGLIEFIGQEYTKFARIEP